MTDIPDKDLLIEPYGDPVPPGGQHVGVTPRGVRITHIPSGTVAAVNTGRSQHIDRMIARDMILAALTHPRF